MKLESRKLLIIRFSYRATFQNVAQYYNFALRDYRFSDENLFSQTTSNINRQYRARYNRTVWFNTIFIIEKNTIIGK